MNFDFGQITRYFDRLAPRERLMLALAVPVVLLIVGYTLLWEPLQSDAAKLSKRITTREKELVQLERQHDQYLDLLREIEASGDMSEVDPSFNMLDYLQKAVSQAVPRDKITSLNPSTRPRPEAPEFVEEIVEIKLTQVSLPQIVDLMYRVEKGEHALRFSRISVKKRFNDQYNFDVHASVSVLKTVEKPAEKAAEHAAEQPAGRAQGRSPGGA